MKKIFLVVTMLAVLACNSVCSANDKWHTGIDNVGVDRFAHAGVSYVINDQLHRNCGFNKFWAAVTTLAIGAAKEQWIDDHFDRGDFAVDCAGVLMYQISF